MFIWEFCYTEKLNLLPLKAKQIFPRGLYMGLQINHTAPYVDLPVR